MIALTAEMRAAAARRMGVDDLDPQAEGALLDVLALVEREHARELAEVRCAFDTAVESRDLWRKRALEGWKP